MVKSEMGIITMSQNKYLEALEEIVLEENLNPKRELNKAEFKLFWKAPGKLSLLAETSRPDLSINVL